MITKYAPEPGTFSATWSASPDSCPGCQELDGETWDNPYDVPDPKEECFSMNGVGKGSGECACTITISDDRYRSGSDEEIDAVAFDPEEFSVDGKSARITNKMTIEELLVAQAYLRSQLEKYGVVWPQMFDDPQGYDIDKSAYADGFDFSVGRVVKPEHEKIAEWLVNHLVNKFDRPWRSGREELLKMLEIEPSPQGHTHVRTYGDKHFVTGPCFANDEDTSTAGVNR